MIAPQDAAAKQRENFLSLLSALLGNSRETENYMDVIFSLGSHSTVNAKHLRCDVCAQVASEEQRGVRDIFRSSGAL